MTPFAEKLLCWFDQHGRHDLPWQMDINPYRVWVSEVMLQQTQVTTVIPYYQRFMGSFPTVEALANATQDNVLHHWTGLGYYARARNLHRTAQVVSANYNGQFPDTVEKLAALPGIGISTAGAIRSIAFKKPAVILDGNVKRVLTRYGAIQGHPGVRSVEKQLWTMAGKLTPGKRNADYTQAIMDLGATVCNRSKPRCIECPFESECLAHAKGIETTFPNKKIRKEKPVKESLFLLLRNKSGEILLEKRPASGIWGGLWTLPECDLSSQIEHTCQQLGLVLIDWDAAEPQRHTFSHYHLDYTPVYVDVEESMQVMAARQQVWYNPCTELTLGTAAPVLKLLQQL